EAAVGAALEVHLEDAGEPEARCDVAAERFEPRVAREAEIGAVAGKGGVGADLPADERGQHFAARRREAVEGPDRIVAAGHVFLELQARRELRHQGVGARLAAVGENARLARAAEELQAHAGAVPGGARAWLDQHWPALRLE